MAFQRSARSLPETEPREARPLILSHRTPREGRRRPVTACPPRSRDSRLPPGASKPCVSTALSAHGHPLPQRWPVLPRATVAGGPAPKVATAQPLPGPGRGHCGTPEVCVTVAGNGEWSRPQGGPVTAPPVGVRSFIHSFLPSSFYSFKVTESWADYLLLCKP